MSDIRHVFVYGTLRPGDVRWHRLAPFVVDDGWLDTVAGELFDTGNDHPAAMFTGGGTVHGHTLALLDGSRSRALSELDDVEGVVGGRFSRVIVHTGRGVDAWAYAYGSGRLLAPIPSGDWLAHRPL